MASAPDGISIQAPKIRNLRWWIGGLLFASTVINYIDRQEEHHAKKSFTQEYIDFLESYQVEYDKKYIFEAVE